MYLGTEEDGFFFGGPEKHLPGFVRPAACGRHVTGTYESTTGTSGGWLGRRVAGRRVAPSVVRERSRWPAQLPFASLGNERGIG